MRKRARGQIYALALVGQKGFAAFIAESSPSEVFFYGAAQSTLTMTTTTVCRSYLPQRRMGRQMRRKMTLNSKTES